MAGRHCAAGSHCPLDVYRVCGLKFLLTQTHTELRGGMMSATFLPIKWSELGDGTPRVTLTDPDAGVRYRADGGGYDMLGTVLGIWLQAQRQPHLHALVTMNPGHVDHGVRVSADGQVILLDGGVGENVMVRVAEAIGVNIRRVYDHAQKSSPLLGFIAEWTS